MPMLRLEFFLFVTDRQKDVVHAVAESQDEVQNCFLIPGMFLFTIICWGGEWQRSKILFFYLHLINQLSWRKFVSFFFFNFYIHPFGMYFFKCMKICVAVCKSVYNNKALTGNLSTCLLLAKGIISSCQILVP